MYCITGGCGFIGSHIAEELVKKGKKIRIIDDLSTGSIENIKAIRNDVEFIQGDIRDSALLEKTCKGVDTVFHQAALVSVGRSIEEPGLNHEINITGTANVLEACRKNGVKKLVMASSAAVYGNDPHLPKKETMNPSPISPYGLAKWQNEQTGAIYASLYGMSITCLRYFNVYGPRQDPRSPYSGVLSIFSKAFSQENVAITVFGDGLQTRDFIYVKDVVSANIVASTITEPFTVFNVGTGKSVALLDVIDIMQDITVKDVNCDFKPERSGDIRFSSASVAKIKKHGFSPRYMLDQGLQEYFKSLTTV